MKARFLRDTSGASAAEFALILPLLLMLLFGIIDGGRWLWTYNEALKSTQAGARVAAVTKIIPTGLVTSYVGTTVNGVTLTQGDIIPAAALGVVTCTKPSGTLGCTCVSSVVACPGAIDSTGWNAIIARMKGLYPEITDPNVVVEYSGSGLGYAGDPDGQDISPLITVRLQGIPFKLITLLMLKSIPGPTPATSYTAEDELGTQSN